MIVNICCKELYYYLSGFICYKSLEMFVRGRTESVAPKKLQPGLL